MSDTTAPGGASLAGTIRRVETGLSAILKVIAVALLGTSAGLAFFSVVMRYAFGSSYAIVEELCRFTIVYAVLLYFGPLITRNAHLRMTIVTDALPARAARWLDIVMTALMAALFVALFVAALNWEKGLYAMGLATMSGEMKAWIPSAALPVGIALGLLYTVFRLIYLCTDDLPPASEVVE